MTGTRWMALTVGAILFSSGCAGIGAAKKNLRTAVEAEKPTLDSCYEEALARDENAAGTMSLHIIVGEKTGKVERIEYADAGFADAELQSCLETSLIGLAIDPKPKANLKVEYQLEFQPAG